MIPLAGWIILLAGCARGSGGAVLTNVSVVSAGGLHTCALRGDGTVTCWGWSTFGQLGTGAMGNISPIPLIIPGLTTPTTIAAGGAHTCAVLRDGTVRCWGSNEVGQLGDGRTTTASSTPVRVAGLTGVTAIAAGWTHTCALLSAGTVRCWGRNNLGQLGNGVSGAISPTPVMVIRLTSVTAIAAGGNHTCSVLAGGTVQCWGTNEVGQVGTGSRTTIPSLPVRVVGLTTATAVTAGLAYSCALLGNGTVTCWGNNNVGQLGTGTVTPFPMPTPVRVVGLTTATQVSAGGDHACARLANSTVQCWGRNTSGQLGTGTTTSSSLPITVPGLTSVVTVAAGTAHTCARLANGTVQCWGQNVSGQLGNATSSRSPTPTPGPVRSPH